MSRVQQKARRIVLRGHRGWDIVLLSFTSRDQKFYSDEFMKKKYEAERFIDRGQRQDPFLKTHILMSDGKGRKHISIIVEAQ